MKYAVPEGSIGNAARRRLSKLEAFPGFLVLGETSGVCLK